MAASTSAEKYDFDDNQQLTQSIIESAPFPIGVYKGREMKIIMANKAIIDVWGKGPDVVGKTYFDVLPELYEQNIYPQLDNVFTTGVPFHARNQRVDLQVDGEMKIFYFNYSFTPVFDTNGHIYGVMNTAADVTDLNIAKHKVEQSEQNIKNMILQAPVAMCILLGPDHVVEVANKLMIDLWGKPVENVINRPIFEGLPDAREQGLEGLLAHVYKTGETFIANERPVVLDRKGKLETVYQNFVYDAYKDADGNIVGVLAITIDVTPQVLARQKIEDIVEERTKELAAANNDLQKSNAELEQFAYVASHDLQEPVRKISTFLEMLQHSLGDVDDRSTQFLNKIENAASRMNILIKDVLTYSTLSKTDGDFTNVDLNQIFRDIETDFELLIEQKKAKVVYQNLPVIEAIPLHMSQLFGNLISNSLKFVKQGQLPEVSVNACVMSFEETSKYLTPVENQIYYKIEVKDNGIGFDAKQASNIFNIFHRLHGKQEFSGTGIGLAICKKIVQNHQGEIHAESVIGQGTMFTVVLPATHND